MPVPKGKLRRPNSGESVTTSVSFDKGQFDWLIDYNNANNLTFAYGIYHAIDCLRAQVDPEYVSVLEEGERKKRKYTRKPSPSAPASERAGPEPEAVEL